MKKQRSMSIQSLLALALPPLLLFGRSVFFRPLEKNFAYDVPLDSLVLGAVTIWLLYRRFLKKRTDHGFSRPFLLFLGVMAFWILYGVAGIFLSDYAPLWEGARECFYLLHGIMILYCLYELLDSRENTAYFLSGLRFCCAVLILYGVFESVTGLHLSTSRYQPTPVVALDGRSWWVGLHADGLFIPTGNFYNQNNYTALLVILLPLLFPTQELPIGRRILRWILLTAAVYVVVLADANIASVSMAASVLVFCLLLRKNTGNRLGLAGGGALLLAGGANWLCRGLVWCKRAVFSGTSAESLLERSGAAFDWYGAGFRAASSLGVPEGTAGPLRGSPSAAVRLPLFRPAPLRRMGASVVDNIIAGVSNASQTQSGALMARLNIYRDGLELFWHTKGLGIGPGGYLPYMQENRHYSYFVNPHNWWLEVLAGYGIFVFAAYLGGLLYLYVQMIRAYLRNRDTVFLTVISMCTAFSLACMAPSSYIGEKYQWILPALCLVLLRQDKERGPAD